MTTKAPLTDLQKIAYTYHVKMGNFKCLNLLDPLTNQVWIKWFAIDNCLKIGYCENGDFVTICRCIPLNSSTTKFTPIF